MDVVINANTNGKGFWTTKKELITVIGLHSDFIYENEEVDDIDEYYMSLDVEFLTDNWTVSKNGLIYTDPLWIEELKEGLIGYGFSKKAVDTLEYSEQGRQGPDYVNLDGGKLFTKEWIKLTQGRTV